MARWQFILFLAVLIQGLFQIFLTTNDNTHFTKSTWISLHMHWNVLTRNVSHQECAVVVLKRFHWVYGRCFWRTLKILKTLENVWYKFSISNNLTSVNLHWWYCHCAKFVQEYFYYRFDNRNCSEHLGIDFCSFTS